MSKVYGYMNKEHDSQMGCVLTSPDGLCMSWCGISQRGFIECNVLQMKKVILYLILESDSVSKLAMYHPALFY